MTLRSGVEYRGLVLSESKAQLEFAQIARPPGKPMHAIVRSIPQDQIVRLKRLNKKQRTAAVAWFEQFRRRAEFAAANAESLQLNGVKLDGQSGWHYAGHWFDVTSTAEEQASRRVIVRLEQLFLAFRQVLPPRHSPTTVPQFLIFSHRDEYRDRLRAWDLEVDNPAFYASRHRTVVASCNLGQIARQAEQAELAEKDYAARMTRRNAEFTTNLSALAETMRTKGFSPDEVTNEIRTRRVQWEIEQAEDKLRLAENHRRNERRLNEAAAVFFRRLAHEAFHAYVENYVYPPDQGRMPRWLNEGLAQVFESAPLDVDHLRIDAPDPKRAAALVADLNSGNPLRLATVLTADEDQFLKIHDREQNDRLYLYSWGMAWQLMFEGTGIDQDRFTEYLVQENESPNAIQRFEKLVGMPLNAWERKWRESWVPAR